MRVERKRRKRLCEKLKANRIIESVKLEVKKRKKYECESKRKREISIACIHWRCSSFKYSFIR